MGEGIGGQGLRGMMDASIGERGKFDRRDKWRQIARNSSAEGMSSLRVNEELSLQARVSAECC